MTTDLGDELFLARLGVLCAEAPGIAALEEIYGGRPSDGAPAATDLVAFRGDEVELVTWVGLLSRLWVHAAHENLTALSVLFDGRARNHPPRAILRAALEQSSRAWWVLAGRDARSRGARAWLARWVGLKEEAKIASRDAGRTGAMATAPARLAALESRISELFTEAPRRSGRWPADATLAGENYGSLTGVTTDAAETSLRSASDDSDVKVPVAALYPTLSALLHPTTTGVLAYADHQGDRIVFPPWEPTFLCGTVLTILAIWRGVLRDLLDYFGWEHPDLPGWSDELDCAITDNLGRRPNG